MADNHSEQAVHSFTVRKSVRPEDLNAHDNLFGGTLLRWIDDEAAIFAILQIGNQSIVTKFISEINFESSGKQGDMLEMSLRVTEFGRTSITLSVVVRNMVTRRRIISIEKIIFVNLGEDGKPAPHGQTEPTLTSERVARNGA